MTKSCQESDSIEIGSVVSDQSGPVNIDTSLIDEIGNSKPEVCVITDSGSKEEFDIYTFNYWDETRGTVLDAIRNIEDKLGGSVLKCKIKEESDRKYEVCEAKKLRDQDIHVNIKLKKKMKAVALGIQTAYCKNQATEVSLHSVSVSH